MHTLRDTHHTQTVGGNSKERTSMSFWQRHETASTSWKRVILWWELRRIPYNLAVILLVLLLSLIQGLLIKGGGGGSPAILIIMFLAALVMMNLLYTSGWILDLIVRKNNHPFILHWKSRLFIVLLVVTFAIVILVHLLVAIYALSAGNAALL